MTLYTKSITAPSQKEDGYRICIMRNPSGFEGRYNEHLPFLAPSKELRDRVKQGCKWDNFKRYFLEELWINTDLLIYVSQLAKEKDVTLLCVEDSPEHCHRSLVAQEIKKLNPNLEVIIK